MNGFKIKSYAKINLALNVIGKTNKMHKIESIISFVDLHDLIYLRLTKKKYHDVSFTGKFSKNIKKFNTVSLLLKLLDKQNFLKDKKFEIRIVKNIPQEAGMGGGSMNAASLINFFVKKKMIKIKKIELEKLTRTIGSDVILGIKPSNIILYSGNKIKKYLKKVKLYTLIVKPNFGCSTKYIYSKVKKYSRARFDPPRQLMFKTEYLKNQNNDLEKVAFQKYPKLKKIKFFLLTIPNNIFVRMSGSGSSIVAYFNSYKKCSYAFRQFKRKFNSHWCITSKTI